MTKEIKCPYIGQGKYSGAVFLFTSDGAALTMQQGENSSYSTFETDIDEINCTNITHKYLQNTYGEVQSPEHAEFIARMAVNEGVLFTTGINESYPCWFAFDEELYFFKSKEYARDSNRRQITIPLPPKGKPNFSDLPKHFDCRCNKCGGKCCAGFCDTWPKVGDKVAIADQHNKLEGELLALTKEYAIISQPYGEQHLHLSGWSFEKPKTAQELKIEELQTKLCENDAVDNYTLACDIVMGNIEGLRYE